MMRLKKSFAGLLFAVTLWGCSTTRPPRYYAATAKMVSVVETPPGDDIRTAVPTAGALLHDTDVLVGFAPPGICRGSVSVPEGLELTVQSQCRSLMDGLERSASRRGYRVLDWNLFRVDPYRTAADKNVDVLFIVDDFEIRRRNAGRFEISTVSFSEQKSATRREPTHLDNALAVGARCKTVFASLEKGQEAPAGEVAGVTVTVKMVAVQDGVSQWYYRHTEGGEANDASGVVERDLYYVSRGTKERGIAKIVVGTVFSGIGIASAIVGSRLYTDGTSLTLRNVGFGLSWFTVIPFAIALPIGAVGIYKEVKPAAYDAPEFVICRDEPLTENPYLRVEAAEGGTSVVVQPSRESDAAAGGAAVVGPSGPGSIRYTEAAVTHFFSELDKLVQSAPRLSDESGASEIDIAEAGGTTATTTVSGAVGDEPAVGRVEPASPSADVSSNITVVDTTAADEKADEVAR